VVVGVFRVVGLVVFMKAKGYLFEVILKKTKGLVVKEKSLFRIPTFGIFEMTLLRFL
jgi:hypothetical protein